MAETKNKQGFHSIAGRIPPQNLEGEVALLGAIMLTPEVIYDIMDIVRPQSFYSERHRIIFEGMLELFGKATPIDLVSLTSKLKDNNQLDRIGGAAYLTQIVESVPGSTNAKHYAELVQKSSLLRGLINAAQHISELGYNTSEDIESILDQAEKKIYEITKTNTSNTFVAIRDSLTDAWERIDKLHNEGQEFRGVPTGFTALDNKLSGLQPSDLIILAARPSMGKTSLALDIARQAAIKHNVPVGIFSLEMSSQQLIDRMLAAEANVDAWKLRTGKLTSEKDFDSIRDSLDRLSNAPIYVDDQPGNNIMKMRSVARRLKNEKGLGLIIVDYLQLMTPTQSKNNDNVVQQITEISRSLKQMARELDVPVLALSQLSRAVEQRGGKPRMSDLRDSGSIEQDADVIMFIHREDKYDKESEKKNIAEIIIDKHRNGPTGSAELYFDADRSTFLNIEQTDYKGDFGGF
jgi:replicative DNA helicase